MSRNSPVTAGSNVKSVIGILSAADGITYVAPDSAPTGGQVVVRVNNSVIGTGTRTIDSPISTGRYPITWAPASSLAVGDFVEVECPITVSGITRQWIAAFVIIPAASAGLSDSQSSKLASIFLKVHSAPVVQTGNTTNATTNSAWLSIVIGDEYSDDTPWGPVTFLVDPAIDLAGSSAKFFFYIGTSSSPTQIGSTVSGTVVDAGETTQSYSFDLSAAVTASLNAYLTNGLELWCQMAITLSGGEFTPINKRVRLLYSRITPS